MRILGLFLLLLTTLHVPAALPDPSEYRKGLMKNPRLHDSSGEQFCWHSRIGIDHILTAYAASKDTRWLDEAVILSHLSGDETEKGPGWV